jgi:hypothetical protein
MQCTSGTDIQIIAPLLIGSIGFQVPPTKPILKEAEVINALTADGALLHDARDISASLSLVGLMGRSWSSH